MSYEQLEVLKNTILDLKTSLFNLKKYPSNSHYKQQHITKLSQLNRNYKYFKAEIPLDNKLLQKRIKELDLKINSLFIESDVKDFLNIINELELDWPDIEIEIKNIQTKSSSFEIPKEIPDNQFKKDLMDAITCYENNCYPASLVMCRRSFEGSLVFAYLKITKRELKQDIICPNCKNNIGKKPLGIVWLHRWAMDEKIYPDKFKSIGILTADLGAGGAHPLEVFSNNPQIANLTIHTTITLLSLIFSNKKLH